MWIMEEQHLMGERFLFMISLVFTSKAFLWIGYSVNSGFSKDVNQLVNQQTEISTPRKKHALLLNSDHFIGLLSYCFHCCTYSRRIKLAQLWEDYHGLKTEKQKLIVQRTPATAQKNSKKQCKCQLLNWPDWGHLKGFSIATMGGGNRDSWGLVAKTK